MIDQLARVLSVVAIVIARTCDGVEGFTTA